MMFKMIKNQKGMSLMEVVVSIGLMGLLSLAITQSFKNQQDITRSADQNEAIETAMKKMTDLFKKKELCEGVTGSLGSSALSSGWDLDSATLATKVSEAKTAIAADTDNEFKEKEQEMIGLQALASQINTSANGQLNSGIRITKLNLKLGSGTGKVPLELTFTFAVKRGAKSDEVEMEKKTTVYVQNDGTGIRCDQYSETTIATESFKQICNSLGGDISGTDCVMNSLNSDLAVNIKKSLCASLDNPSNSRTLVDGLCAKIDLTNNMVMKNVSPTHITINDKTRTKFDFDECTGEREFISGYTVGGNKICTTVTRAFVGNSYYNK